MRRYFTFLAILLIICLNLMIALPLYANDDYELKTVRVGFFKLDSYHEIKNDGVKSGYGYDFLMLTRRYVNLKYKYIGYDKNWADMPKMLLNNEIDMVVSASKTPEREKLFDFSHPIGINSVKLNVKANETRYITNDLKTYNGMVVGLLKGNSNNQSFFDFAKKYGFTYTVRYYDTDRQMQIALQNGYINAFVSSSIKQNNSIKLLNNLDSEYLYVMVKKGNKELLDKINYAITQMDISEGDWRSHLHYKNYTTFNDGKILFSEAEKEYIKAHSTEKNKIIVALDDNWSPFSFCENDQYKGIIPDFWNLVMQQTGMNFEYIKPGTKVCNIETSGIKEGKADIYLCYTGSIEDTEAEDLLTSSPLMELGAAYLVRKDCPEIIRIGLCKNTPFINTQIELNENQRTVEYDNSHVALNALKNGDVDAIFLYAYEAEMFGNSDKLGLLKFKSLPHINVNLYAIMPDNKNHLLIGILSKCINNIDNTDKDTIISKNLLALSDEMSIQDWIFLHPVPSAIISCLLLIAFLTVIIVVTRHNARIKFEEARHKQELIYRKEIEDALAAANEASKAKTTFLNNMSHDIRTPMNAVIGFTELLEKNLNDKDKALDYLHKIRSSSDYLLDLINNVLELSRVESGISELDETPCNLETFEQMIHAVFDNQMQKKGLEFTTKMDVKHYRIMADSVKLKGIFLNFISNAYKYTMEGGSVTVTITELPCDKENYRLYQTIVKDTGIGMAKDFIPRIFDSFSRERTSTESKVIGTGLGMPIAKDLIELMNGTIQVESELGVGSTFIITIPHMVIHHHENEHDKDKMKLADLDKLQGKRILLAEDNELNAEIAKEILQEVGFAVEHAEDGVILVDMLAKAEAGYYDLIITDIQMPNMDGYKAAETIRKMTDEVKANIPIIAMTANAFEEDKKQAFAAGMNGHIAKPIDIAELMKALAELL